MFADIEHLHQLPHCSALLAEEAKYVSFAALGRKVTQAERVGERGGPERE
jgi:hypothetical protein